MRNFENIGESRKMTNRYLRSKGIGEKGANFFTKVQISGVACSLGVRIPSGSGDTNRYRRNVEREGRSEICASKEHFVSDLEIIRKPRV